MSRIEADLVRGLDIIENAMNRPTVEEPAPDLLSALKHLVRWHDQLTPTDIQMAEAAIAQAEMKPVKVTTEEIETP